MSRPLDMAGQTGPIRPTATDTVLELMSMVESMLGWRLSRAGLGPTEEAVRVYILTQYPLRGRGPTCQEITAWFGFTSPSDVQTILERLHTLDLLYLDPE